MQGQSHRDSGAGGASSQGRAPRTANLGFPSIGVQRELKWATEAYWRKAHDLVALEQVAAMLRERHWKLQQAAALTYIPSNDFSLYDRMLDTSVMLDAIPERFQKLAVGSRIDLMFAMARGAQEIPALEMTKWFDTNYHYVVPELTPNQTFTLKSNPAVDAFREAKALGIQTRPVLVGPLTYLLLARFSGNDVLTLLPSLLDAYVQILSGLFAEGAEWVQIDEPALVLDIDGATREAYIRAYKRLAQAVPGISIMLTTYFGDLRENIETLCSLPVAGVHLDGVRAAHEIEALAFRLDSRQVLSCGVVNGRNIWRNDLDASLKLLYRAVEILGVDRVIVAPSCSLLHVPVDVAEERSLNDEMRSWLSFGLQKLDEIAILASAVSGETEKSTPFFASARAAVHAHKTSGRIHDKQIEQRTAAITEDHFHRTAYSERSRAQAAKLRLPLFPTTTIGSLPQTPDVRELRVALRHGRTTQEAYDEAIRTRTAEVIRWQESIGIDVLVHGEFERNDMVEFFGERLRGCMTTANGWVQSYGTRCVKPPVIFGDVERHAPMTVALSAYAQSLTEKPVKGMLTGPITILQWSFVREDQPRQTTAFQVALALRDEVADLEQAGLRVIQIDEPALREGLPLRKSDHAAYLAWSVNAFRLSAGGAKAETQIHTHMCYAEFDHIVDAIAALDADVISIETARSAGSIFETLSRVRFPYMIGPGVYDIHSPNVPHVADILALMESAERVVPAEQLWINPDCGLKTRRWEEVRPALGAMVDAAKQLRARALVSKP